MSERKELEELARDFVDLWQEHLVQQASDPALSRWVRAWLAALPEGVVGERAGAHGAATPGAASGDVGRRLDEYARRLARCEERLDTLERQAGGSRCKTSGKRRGGGG